MLYLSFTWPQLTYGILSWGRCGLVGFKKVIKAKKKVVKLLFGSSIQSTYIVNTIFQFHFNFKLYREVNSQSVTYFSNRIDSFQVSHSHTSNAFSHISTAFSHISHFISPMHSVIYPMHPVIYPMHSVICPMYSVISPMHSVIFPMSYFQCIQSHSQCCIRNALSHI